MYGSETWALKTGHMELLSVAPESLDIERRHMAALTWDAMFKSRRAAILADGGGGGYLTRWLYGVQQKWVVLCRF